MLRATRAHYRPRTGRPPYRRRGRRCVARDLARADQTGDRAQRAAPPARVCRAEALRPLRYVASLLLWVGFCASSLPAVFEAASESTPIGRWGTTDSVGGTEAGGSCYMRDSTGGASTGARSVLTDGTTRSAPKPRSSSSSGPLP